MQSRLVNFIWQHFFGRTILMMLWLNNHKQESPPAWTQEAYCPPCSEYSFCCPNWVPPRAGYPRQGFPLAGFPPGRVPPQQGTPPGRVLPRQGTSPAGYPPPQLDLAGNPPPDVYPMAFWVMLHSIMGYGYPPPLWTDRWKDRHVSKHYFPVVLRTRAAITA